MKPSCLVAFPLVLFAACSGADTSHVVGAYDLDLASFRTRLQAELPAGDAAKAQLEAMMAGVRGAVELRQDGSASTTMQVPAMKIDESVPGTWKLDGDVVAITKKDKQNQDVTVRAKVGKGELLVDETAGGKPVVIRWVKR